jgi:hypothetical protein
VRLIELIQTTRWTDVKHKLLEKYPDSDASAYERAYLNLRSLEVRENPMRIQLEWVEALEAGDAPYIDVNGYDGSLHRDREDFSMYSAEAKASMGDQEVRFALDLTPWEEWLGMGIAPETLETFQPAEIAAHCLWEMTWHGFDQAKTQAFREQLNATAASLQAMTPEERSRNTIPIQDIETALDWEAIQAERLEAIPILEKAMDELTATPGLLTEEQKTELVGLMTQWNQAMGFYEMPPRPLRELKEENDTTPDTGN